ncbi:DNA-binding protein [Thermoanaerobacterium sp. RBIITD]|uniref:DNA-binding protein n=1 Tax=Thermoanaerobacterium sp. RBIITD TaxID=1550240 RepID=UPI000BB86C74|nr:DNA-binding protein [Thermoanaerobacterium sp. RBIITD]SNX52950.1 hypothetical protein SAMN05660242_0419 [Thermoanaerobacterium sp. RBIITD]
MAKRLIAPIIFLAFVLTTSYLFAAEPTITDMINNPQKYDGKSLSIKGEVIGDIMKRGDFAWVNISDGNNALGVWIPYNLTKDIKYKGNYADKGDIITVQGTFNRVCKEHGGDMDFHADKIIDIKGGEKVNHIIDTNRLVYLGVATIIVILLAIMKNKK